MGDAERLTSLQERFKNEKLARLFNMELVKLSRVGWAVVKAPVNENTLIVDGPVQGGIVAAVADFAGVYAAMATLDEGHTPASHINIDFLRPVIAGETMYAEARVRAQTRGTIFVDVNVFGQDMDLNKVKACGRIKFSKPKKVE